MGDNTRRQFLAVAGASTLGILGAGNAVASSERKSASEAGIIKKIERYYNSGEYEKVSQILERENVDSKTRQVTKTTQPSNSDGQVSPQHWFNKGSSTITHTVFLWKKSQNHDYLSNNVYQCDISWDLNRTSQDAGGIRLDSPTPMDQAIVAFNNDRWDYLPGQHQDGGLRYSGKILNKDSSPISEDQCYVKNEPIPTASRQDAAVVSFDDGEIASDLDAFPAQGSGFMGLRLAQTTSEPGAIETYYSHTWSAFDSGRWTGVLGDLTVNLPVVSISLDIPTGVDDWKSSQTYYMG